MKPEDITPEKVVELYRKHGKLPRPYDATNTGPRCCGIGIVALEAGITIPEASTGRKQAALDQVAELLGKAFVQDFVSNFDCRLAWEDYRRSGDGPGARAGHEVAAACREAFSECFPSLPFAHSCPG